MSHPHIYYILYHILCIIYIYIYIYYMYYILYIYVYDITYAYECIYDYECLSFALHVVVDIVNVMPRGRGA